MGILDQLMGPTGMNSQQQKQMLMNAPQVTTGQPTYVAPEPSFLNRLGAGAMDYLGDPTNRARLAMAFNTMRLNPDPNIAKMAQSRIETAQAMKLLNQQGNRTADALRAAAQKETDPTRKAQLAIAADLVIENPSIAKEASKLLFDTTAAGTEAFRTKALQASAAGLVPGTPEYKRFMGAESQYGGLSDEALSGVSSIRKEFMGIPEVKSFQSQAASYGRINASAEDPSAAGDLALIFNYMKLLDPGSVVREGEFATAQNAAGVPDRITNLYNNLLSGTRLNDSQRADFISRAEKIYKDAERQYESYESQYKKFMKPFIPSGQSVDDYFPSFRYVANQSRSKNVNPSQQQESVNSLEEEAQRRGLIK